MYRFMFMLKCWEVEPNNRPSFCDLVKSLSKSLGIIAGYIDISAIRTVNMSGPLTSEQVAHEEPVERYTKTVTVLQTEPPQNEANED